MIDHEQFEDARTLLSSATLVYMRAQDQARVAKASRISRLVDRVHKANAALRECRYADAEVFMEQGITERVSLSTERPLSLQPPDCTLFRGEGQGAAKAAVLSRAHAGGVEDRTTALSLLEKGEFEAAKDAAASSAQRFAWWASHGGGGGGGEGVRKLYMKL